MAALDIDGFPEIGQLHDEPETGGAARATTSISALRGTDDIGAYGASKAALTSVARSLAVGLGPDGIRANCIAPAMTASI